MTPSIKTLRYHFKLSNGQEKTFEVQLENPSMQLVPHSTAESPAWARLEFYQCSNCPLSVATHPCCPIAKNLAPVIEFFKDSISIEMVDITITSENRSYQKRASLQFGISSLMGIHMVTSGCPVMDKLRPMVYTHLPFSTADETLYRAISMYLISQFLRHKRGHVADWDVKGLVKIYEEIGKVNQAFVKRIVSINPRDSTLNALVSLDCFASYNTLSITENYLEELESVFMSYLNETPQPAGL